MINHGCDFECKIDYTFFQKVCTYDENDVQHVLFKSIFTEQRTRKIKKRLETLRKWGGGQQVLYWFRNH